MERRENLKCHGRALQGEDGVGRRFGPVLWCLQFVFLLESFAANAGGLQSLGVLLMGVRRSSPENANQQTEKTRTPTTLRDRQEKM